MPVCKYCNGTHRIPWPEAGMMQDCSCIRTTAAVAPTQLNSGGYVELALLDSNRVEVYYPGYSRVRIARKHMEWNVLPEGCVSNASTVYFPTALPGSFGIIVDYVMATVDNMYYDVIPIQPRVYLTNGVTVEFAPGELKLSL